MAETTEAGLRHAGDEPRDVGALLLVRISLTDRPGALGQVASRIGALAGDIIGVDVLERNDTVAVDEFAVSLPEFEYVELLVREIEEVDGASVEEWRVVDRFPDPRLDALISADQLCQAEDHETVFRVLVEDARKEFNVDWVAVVNADDALAQSGDALPDRSMLHALACGTAVAQMVPGHARPADLAIATLAEADAVLLMGRNGHPIRGRERQQIAALARVADRVIALLNRAEALSTALRETTVSGDAD